MTSRDQGGRPEAPDAVPSPEEERRWRDLLEGNLAAYRFGRSLFRHIPSDTRCQLCAAPFHGLASPLFRAIGKGQWPKNPKFCMSCFSAITKHRGGAEVSCSLLFADVRDSTKLAERMSPTEFHGLMNRFFEAASRSLIDQDAIVDKFVGDEIIGIFVPAMATSGHARHAVAAATDLLERTARLGAAGERLPVGAGVSAGTAYVGSIGEGLEAELTAMGDLVNTTARLASTAAAGEVLVTLPAATAAGLPESLEHRSLKLKGKSDDTEVAVVPVP